MSGSGISWAICKSAPRSRQTTTPAPHHSVFYFLPPNQQRQNTEGIKVTERSRNYRRLRSDQTMTCDSAKCCHFEISADTDFLVATAARLQCHSACKHRRRLPYAATLPVTCTNRFFGLRSSYKKRLGIGRSSQLQAENRAFMTRRRYLTVRKQRRRIILHH